MAALNYIYRNLHAGQAFSVKHRGKVVARLEDFVAYNVRFKVSEPGRLRAIAEGARNVHAFVAAEYYIEQKIEALGLNRVAYNPYRTNSFTVNGEPIREAAAVLFTNGQCYLLKDNYEKPITNFRTESPRP